MSDKLSPKQRSYAMSRVGHRNTRPEMIVRRGLHSYGLRYRFEHKKLPGTPDIVLARYHVVIFVHGCFWHCHGCRKNTVPATNTEFWSAKFERNATRDRNAIISLQELGWRVLVIWECAIVGRKRIPHCLLLDRICRFIFSNSNNGEIAGSERDQAR